MSESKKRSSARISDISDSSGRIIVDAIVSSSGKLIDITEVLQFHTAVWKEQDEIRGAGPSKLLLGTKNRGKTNVWLYQTTNRGDQTSIRYMEEDASNGNHTPVTVGENSSYYARIRPLPLFAHAVPDQTKVSAVARVAFLQKEDVSGSSQMQLTDRCLKALQAVVEDARPGIFESDGTGSPHDNSDDSDHGPDGSATEVEEPKPQLPRTVINIEDDEDPKVAPAQQSVTPSPAPILEPITPSPLRVYQPAAPNTAGTSKTAEEPTRVNMQGPGSAHVNDDDIAKENLMELEYKKVDMQAAAKDLSRQVANAKVAYEALLAKEEAQRKEQDGVKKAIKRGRESLSVDELVEFYMDLGASMSAKKTKMNK